jgi:hypothetical protein
MFTGFLRATVVAVLACGLGAEPARAEIYTWVDANGVVNVGNETPPEGVRITNVTPAVPLKVAAYYETVREVARQAELQAMADRVRQLENEAELARWSAPPTQIINPVVNQWTPVTYNIDISAPASPGNGCDSDWAGWGGCGGWGGWGGSGYYSPGYIVNRPVRPQRPQPRAVDRPISLPPLFGATLRFAGG